MSLRRILEVEEENYSEKSEASSLNTLTVRANTNVNVNDNALHFKYDLPTINRMTERRDSEFTYRFDQSEDDSLLAFCPIEVHERKYLRNLQQQKEQQRNEPSTSMAGMSRKEGTNTMTSNSLQVPVISVPNMLEKPPPAILSENIYQSESMTIIDTDLPVIARREDFLSLQ